MALQFKLPDIGEGVAEGEIIKWLVSEGDQVAEHQAVVEVMTDKATVEIPSPAAGRIASLKAKPGDVVPVGSVLFELETGGDKSAAPSAKPAAAAQAPRSEAPKAPAAKAPSAPAAPRQVAAPLPSRPQQVSQPRAPAPAARAQAPATERKAAPQAAAAGGGRTLEFKLPDIGEGVAEGEIVKWLVAEGDAVAEHQSVVEVMTDKATVEIPSPAAGRVTALKAKAGDVVPVGSVLFTLALGSGAAAAPEAAQAEEAAQANEEGAEQQVAEEGAPQEAAVGARAGAEDGAEAGDANGNVLAVPSARRVARELGIDLGQVRGTGRHGVVRRADVEAYAQSAQESSAAAPAAPAAPSRTEAARPERAPAPAPVSTGSGVARETRVPFRGVRRKIAEAMVRSKQTAAHFTVVEEVDVTALVELRAAAKVLGEEQGVKVTYMPFIMKATALGLARFPMLNGHLDEAAGEIVQASYVNLGIAMDTEQGLIVPVIREVQQKGLLQLAVELSDLGERTRAGKVRQDELKGSTFSITNAGNIGGILATPIINVPDIAILGVHRIVKRPGVVETPQGDQIAVRHYMNLSCSVDHRLADGADAARFLVYLKRLLEQPGLLAL
jgi:pyruvate dehydrogenase E2 component (dihydrolipoyllysine-residue acetyltransferase)